MGRPSTWQIREAPDGATRLVDPGAPELSAILQRMRSRRLSSQMPPLGTVRPDREAIDLIEAWIAQVSLKVTGRFDGSVLARRCRMATTNAIVWQHDFDVALKQAQQQKSLLLLDFSAAPM